MSKKTLILIITALIILIAAFFILAYFSGDNQEEITEEKEKDLINCLKEEGVVIYGSIYCPACTALAERFGGYEMISPIYVECSQEWERCDREIQAGYVPEIQIKGEVYQGPRELESIAEAAGCNI